MQNLNVQDTLKFGFGSIELDHVLMILIDDMLSFEGEAITFFERRWQATDSDIFLMIADSFLLDSESPRKNSDDEMECFYLCFSHVYSGILHLQPKNRHS
jgi:hypothetical protein